GGRRTTGPNAERAHRRIVVESRRKRAYPKALLDPEVSPDLLVGDRVGPPSAQRRERDFQAMPGVGLAGPHPRDRLDSSLGDVTRSYENELPAGAGRMSGQRPNGFALMRLKAHLRRFRASRRADCRRSPE